MNEFNVLLAAATNGTPSGSLFDALFARYIAPQESWRELESPLPITILAAGEDLIDYRIYGNTENGESVGERTENLFDINNLYSTVGIQGQTFTKPQSAYFFDVFSGTSGGSTPMDLQKSIPVTSGTYTLSFEESETKIAVAFYDGETQTIIVDSTSVTPRTFDIPSDGYISIRCENPAVCSVKKLQIVKASTAPTSYIPYGYKLPMVVRGRNLFDKDSAPYSFSNYISSNNVLVSAGGFDVTDFIEVNGNKDYYLSNVNIVSYNPAICFYDANKEFISGVTYAARASMRITTPENCKYVRLSVGNRLYDSAMLTEGSTAPTEYIPYYRDEENIYIGSDPLAEDEYVDFGEQKIYRMINGILTPTDPPVPIPALPTIDGETIIDYNPSETPAVEPKKMYVKYKPQ